MNKIGILCLLFLMFAQFAYAGNCSPEINNSGERCSYRYELVLNNNDKVCKHMKEVFDWKFVRLFDTRGISEKQRRGVFFPLYSHYPSSKEFDAIVWRAPKLVRESHDGKMLQWPVPVAEFDIDNDGEVEVVIKNMIFNGGRDSQEALVIFNKSKISISDGTNLTNLYRQRVGYLNSIGNGERIIRPFILDGKSYLMMYESTGRGALWGKQTMWVRQYKGEGKNKVKISSEIEDVCKFNMVRFDE